MNNNQKKLFNITNRIEKLLYDNGYRTFSKEFNYYSAIMDLKMTSINHNIIEPLITNITIPYKVNFKFQIKEENLQLYIWT